MHKSWRIFSQITILSAIICGVALADETQTQPEDANPIYRSQMAKYPALSKEFAGVIEANAQPRIVPSGSDEAYLWQLEEYKMLNAEFNEVYTRNIERRPVSEEIYLWQLEEYKELDKEFYNEHRRGF